MAHHDLPIPPHFDPNQVDKVWRVAYQDRAADARRWTTQHDIAPAGNDRFKTCLILVDVQNTFCIPGFELFVGGRSGTGAVDDNRRLCQFIYRNLNAITQICPTMDTHQAMQIFHPIFFIDLQGNHPDPYTLISAEDVRQGRWAFNPALADHLGVDAAHGQQHLLHYTDELSRRGKYTLTVWPYHAMLGGISHALVSSLEEAIFFHSVVRYSQPAFEIKGQNPLTEHYSVVGPEVLTGPDGKPIGRKNEGFVARLRQYDAVIVAGQAKSHCVAWTIDDLLADIRALDERLIRKIYLLEDCTSPVVVPGVVDYTEQADAAFQRFAGAGAHLVRSTQPLAQWPDIAL